MDLCACLTCLQDIIRPLGLQIDELAKLKPTAEDPAQQAPVRRMVILQVLLCKLVDLLDAGQPWDAGPLFDADEEPRMFQRNFRCGLQADMPQLV